MKQERLLRKGILNEKMLNSLIVKTENAIRAELEKQQSIAQELADAKAAFDLVQEQYNSHQAVIDLEQATLNALVHIKTGTETRTNTQISNVHKKEYVEPKRLDLIGMLRNILLVKDHFIELETLIKLLLNEPEIKKLNLTKQKLMSRKYYLLKVLPEGKASGLRMYKTKVGLAEWFVGDTIKPTYLKSFMS